MLMYYQTQGADVTYDNVDQPQGTYVTYDNVAQS